MQMYETHHLYVPFSDFHFYYGPANDTICQ